MPIAGVMFFEENFGTFPPLLCAKSVDLSEFKNQKVRIYRNLQAIFLVFIGICLPLQQFIDILMSLYFM